jgi:dUTP pyrophosphatase
MKINIRIIDNKIKTEVPSYQKVGDIGLDLISTSIAYTDDFIEYGTNLSIEIPEGFGGFLFPRSSISNYDLHLCNSIGVIDSNYRGEIRLRFKTLHNYDFKKVYKIGDRVGQLVIMPIPKINLELVKELSNTVRGTMGFGSSGV